MAKYTKFQLWSFNIKRSFAPTETRYPIIAETGKGIKWKKIFRSFLEVGEGGNCFGEFVHTRYFADRVDQLVLSSIPLWTWSNHHLRFRHSHFELWIHPPLEMYWETMSKTKSKSRRNSNYVQHLSLFSRSFTNLNSDLFWTETERLSSVTGLKYDLLSHLKYEKDMQEFLLFPPCW